MCLYPKLRKNKKYSSTKKNGGAVPVMRDNRVAYVPSACGNCMECLKMKGREWQVRLSEEIRHRKDGKFCTMTFSDESMTELEEGIVGLSGYDLDNEIATKGMRRFLGRWRKKYGKSVRHWAVTELGGTKTERLHIHGIFFTDEVDSLKSIWKYGHVWIGDYVNGKTIGYIVKYLSKSDEVHKEYKPKMLTSDGIGRGYLDRVDSRRNRFRGKDTITEYVSREGVKINLPVYYRNKLYSEEEREKLWLYKLDENVRYVDGHKIDVSVSDEEYYNAVEYARIKSKRLGYGDDSINWDRRKYENDRRNMLKLEKINKERSS